MNFLLLVPLLVCGQIDLSLVRMNPVPSNALMDRDWESELDDVLDIPPEDRIYRHLQLLPNLEDRGTAWYIEKSANGAFACRGIYKAGPDPEDKRSLLLLLSLTRKYKGTRVPGSPGNSYYRWAVDTDYEPTGVTIRVPHDQNNRLVKPISMEVVNAYWSKSDGTPFVKYKKSSGLGALLGSGKELPVDDTGHLKVGAVFKMDDAYGIPFLQDSLDKNSPPGFTRRKITDQAAKPSPKR